MALIAQAQEKKTYTNFADTTFNLQEVVVHTNRKARPQVTKLDVPMKYLPLSVNSLEAGSLESGPSNLKLVVSGTYWRRLVLCLASGSRPVMAPFNRSLSEVSTMRS